jgi:signal transduction histidine kinase
LLGELLSTAILAGGVCLAAIIVIHELGAPLRGLARVADQIGSLTPVQVVVAGPREVRKVAKTLNAMQARIAQLVADRTQALAAVSHDLRTPISRMRLQADDLPDLKVRQSMIESLDDMEHMVASILTYLGGETDVEQARPVDLAQLLITQAEAAADAGHSVRYEGPEHARVIMRALGIKRACNNLIGNAITYGGNATVRLTLLPGAAKVQVDDDGPGIPEPDLRRALEPFCRLDPARGGEPGGVGLGLSIASQAAAREGGSLTLANRAEGGLRAEMVLPLRCT